MAFRITTIIITNSICMTIFMEADKLMHVAGVPAIIIAGTLVMPRCACASEVDLYGSVFVCVCV